MKTKLIIAGAVVALATTGCTDNQPIIPGAPCETYDAEAYDDDGNPYECKYVDQSQGEMKWIYDGDDPQGLTPVVAEEEPFDWDDFGGATTTKKKPKKP